MPSLYEQNKVFIVDNGVYRQKNTTFIRAERVRKRTRSICIDQHHLHLYTCNMANKVYKDLGGEEIIPICHACSMYASEVKIKPNLAGKNQFTHKLAKRFQCKWLLRKSLPDSSSGMEVVEEVLENDEEIRSSQAVDLHERNSKRTKRTFAEVEEDTKAELEEKFSAEKLSLEEKYEAEQDLIRTNLRSKESEISKRNY